MSYAIKSNSDVWRVYAADMLRLFAQAGWPAIVGLGLVAFALAYEFSGNRQTRQQIAELAAQRTDARELAQRPGSVTLSAREQLDNFYRRFPSSDTLPEVLLQLDQIARAQGLSPLRADYRVAAEPGTPLQRVRVTIPVHGTYKALRAWLLSVQKALPEVSIDSLQAKRNDIGIEDMEAEARFAVFLSAARTSAEKITARTIE
ncbi:MAG TPA: GspMb/PilO family protein [Rhodocyclaceae bacterium]|nr:GspMb/PilO family protein [Rhodocyclaceae bacterium]